MPHQKKHYYHFLKFLLFAMLITPPACVNENIANISENVIVNQDISFPLGPANITIPEEITTLTSDVPGPYGTFYFDDYPIPLNARDYELLYYLYFDLGSHDTRIEWIKSFTLRLIILNNFPVPVRIQYYTIDSNGTTTDSVFADGPASINAAQADINWVIQKKAEHAFNIPFEGEKLNHVKEATHLLAKTLIHIENPSSPVRLSSKNYLHINLSSQFHLEYNIKDLKE